MEPHEPGKKRSSEGLPAGQPPPPRRFRIVKLEERIAPGNRNGWFKNTKACYVVSFACYSEYCW